MQSLMGGSLFDSILGFNTSSSSSSSSMVALKDVCLLSVNCHSPLLLSFSAYIPPFGFCSSLYSPRDSCQHIYKGSSFRVGAVDPLATATKSAEGFPRPKALFSKTAYAHVATHIL